ESGCAPHRLGQVKQRRREFGLVVPEVSLSTESRRSPSDSSIVESTVTRIEQVDGIREAVYNLEVEGSHNYLAEGILVNNCAELQEIAEPIFAGGKRDHHLVENVPPG